MFRKSLAALVAMAAVAFGSGCGIANAIDCQSICSRYQTCFSSNYDVGACADRCRRDSANDSDYQHKADVCNTCIDDRSCSSATFNCGGSCGSIVP